MAPTPPPAPAPADAFALIIDGLCKVVAASCPKRGVAGPLVCLIWSRLRRTVIRFAALAAKVQASTLPALSPTRHRTRTHHRHSEPRLPRGFAWLIRLAGSNAACIGGQLRHWLAQPETAALIAAAPQFGRILRPLFWMLGVRLTPGQLPSPPAARRKRQTRAIIAPLSRTPLPRKELPDVPIPSAQSHHRSDPVTAAPTHRSRRDPRIEQAIRDLRRQPPPKPPAPSRQGSARSPYRCPEPV